MRKNRILRRQLLVALSCTLLYCLLSSSALKWKERNDISLQVRAGSLGIISFEAN